MIVFCSRWGKARSDTWVSSTCKERYAAIERWQDCVAACASRTLLCLVVILCNLTLHEYTMVFHASSFLALRFSARYLFFFFYPMWFDTVWKTYAALHDRAPNVLAFDACSKASMCRTSCLWFLVLVLGLGCNLCSLTWFAWLEQVFGCSVWVWLQWLQWLTLGPWPIER